LITSKGHTNVAAITPADAPEAALKRRHLGLILVAAEWGSEEGMVSEINGNRIEKSVLFGEGYGGGARSHGLRLGG
jgi:hypothetical protein